MSTHSRWPSLSPPIYPALVFQMLSFYIHFCSLQSFQPLSCPACCAPVNSTWQCFCVSTPEICPEVSTCAHLLHQKMHCFGILGSFSCPFHPLPLLFWAIVPVCSFASLRGLVVVPSELQMHAFRFLTAWMLAALPQPAQKRQVPPLQGLDPLQFGQTWKWKEAWATLFLGWCALAHSGNPTSLSHWESVWSSSMLSKGNSLERY